MKHEMDEALRDAQFAFLGILLSGFTHEVKNHLAIINESSGLMGDLIELDKGMDNETGKRFQKIISSIAEHIDRANSLVKNLNSFGHRMDSPDSVFSVNEVLREEIALMRKFARLKGINIDLELQENLPSVRSNPSLFQFLVFVFIDAMLAGTNKGERIKLVSSSEDQVVVVQLEKMSDRSAVEEGEADPSHTELVGYVVAKLGVDFEKKAMDNRIVYRLILPLGDQ